MKKLSSVLMALLMVLVMMVPVVAAGPETFDLSLNLQPGQSYSLRTTMTQKLIQQVSGQRITMDQTNVNAGRYTVVSLDEQKNYNLIAEYNDLRVETNVFLNDEPIAIPNINDQMQGLFTNNPLKLNITNRGVVTRLENFAVFKSKLEEQVKKLNMSQEETQATWEVLQSTVTEEYMTQSWQNNFAYIPSKAVALGESWSSEYSLAQPIPLQIKLVYTLQSVSEDEAVISIRSDFNTDTTMTTQGNEFDVKMNGVMEGTYVIDRATGWIKTANMQQTIKAILRTEIDKVNYEFPMEVTALVETVSH